MTVRRVRLRETVSRHALSAAMLVTLAVGWSTRPTPIPQSALFASALTEAPNDGIIAVDWGVLATLDYRSGKVSDTLRALHGKQVRIPGFIVPLEDFQEEAKEFLLVPYFGACVRYPPPPPNQLVYAKMSGGKTKLSWFEPVWIEGTLHVTKVDSPYGAAGFRMSVSRIAPYTRRGS